MALSTITGQTPLGTTKPGNLKGTIAINIDSSKGAPAGYAVSLVGKLDNSNPGMYGMVFGYTVPAGMKVDPSQSGSLQTPGSGKFDYMKVAVVSDAKAGGSTEYWEVWFAEADVNSDGWSTEVTFVIGSSSYSYVFSKKRTGDGLDAGVLSDYADERRG